MLACFSHFGRFCIKITLIRGNHNKNYGFQVLRNAKNRLKSVLGTCLGLVLACLGLSGACLGPVLACLGLSWACLGCVLGLSCPVLGLSWAVLGPPWDCLGPVLAALGPSGLVGGLSWPVLGPSWACLGTFFTIVLEVLPKNLLAFTFCMSSPPCSAAVRAQHMELALKATKNF